MDVLRAQMGLVEHLDDDSIRVSTVKGSAPVPVIFKGMDNLNTSAPEFIFQLLHYLYTFDHKP